MQYTTLQQTKYLLGEHHCGHWQTIRDRIEFLNRYSNGKDSIEYHLRKRRDTPFDIQVHYDSLSNAHKEYIAWRERKALEATVQSVGGTAQVFDFMSERARLKVV